MEEQEKTWTWLMPSGKMYRVVTNQEDGTIKVYDQNRKLVSKEEKLSKEAVSIIERIFLENVAAKVGAKEKEKEKGEGTEDTLVTATYIR